MQGRPCSSFDTWQIAPNQWAETVSVYYGGFDDPALSDGGWISVDYSIHVCGGLDGTYGDARTALEFSVPYQILPALDQCAFHGKLTNEAAATVLTDFSFVVTPLQIHVNYSCQPVDSSQTVTDYYRFFDGQKQSMDVYHAVLPDKRRLRRRLGAAARLRFRPAG